MSHFSSPAARSHQKYMQIESSAGRSEELPPTETTNFIPRTLFFRAVDRDEICVSPAWHALPSVVRVLSLVLLSLLSLPPTNIQIAPSFHFHEINLSGRAKKANYPGSLSSALRFVPCKFTPYCTLPIGLRSLDLGVLSLLSYLNCARRATK